MAIMPPGPFLYHSIVSTVFELYLNGVFLVRAASYGRRQCLLLLGVCSRHDRYAVVYNVWEEKYELAISSTRFEDAGRYSCLDTTTRRAVYMELVVVGETLRRPSFYP